ncbi:hypothetical protein R3P38DRAFT_1117644 [Favolaschia claudopus]|uniref:Uncharacterized protein n=1 Tax=Favolaschia claudopus TaxID=2862362 RepID=A0AAW0B8I6_9AGAR
MRRIALIPFGKLFANVCFPITSTSHHFLLLAHPAPPLLPPLSSYNSCYTVFKVSSATCSLLSLYNAAERHHWPVSAARHLARITCSGASAGAFALEFRYIALAAARALPPDLAAAHFSGRIASSTLKQRGYGAYIVIPSLHLGSPLHPIPAALLGAACLGTRPRLHNYRLLPPHPSFCRPAAPNVLPPPPSRYFASSPCPHAHGSLQRSLSLSLYPTRPSGPRPSPNLSLFRLDPAILRCSLYFTLATAFLLSPLASLDPTFVIPIVGASTSSSIALPLFPPLILSFC